MKKIRCIGYNSSLEFEFCQNEETGDSLKNTIKIGRCIDNNEWKNMNQWNELSFYGQWEFFEFLNFCKEIVKYFNDYDKDDNFGVTLEIKNNKYK